MAQFNPWNLQQGAPPITLQWQARTSKYYSVTEAEIETYAQTGWAFSIFLGLFGGFAGFAFSCHVALVQGTISNEAKASLASLKASTLLVAIIFLILTLASLALQRRAKGQWSSISHPQGMVSQSAASQSPASSQWSPQQLAGSQQQAPPQHSVPPESKSTEETGGVK